MPFIFEKMLKMRIVVSKILFLCITSIALLGCLKNDLPYPTVELKFLSMAAEGEVSAAVIDDANRNVTLNMGESVDLTKVNILTYTVTEGAELSATITGGINLTNPFGVTLSLYQDYFWTITAQQTITRYFTVVGQVGESIIDVPGKRAIAYVSKNSDLANIMVTSLKLGPEDITVSTPNVENKTIDCSNGPVTIDVSYLDKTEKWSLYVLITDVSVDVSAVDAWTNVMWAYGTAEEGKDNGFEYRKAGTSTWNKVPASWLIVDGGTFKACIRHLEANTEYEVRAYSGELYSAVVSTETGGYFEIPNGSFDNWWLDGKIWCPWTEGGTPFWGTGNKGATTLGDSNTFPSSDTWDGGAGFSAQLDTRFVGIATVGKLAAGNMFSGDYKKTDGTNGILDFGRRCSVRPTRMKGYWKYKCEPISHTSTEYAHLKGQPDTANVYIALTDWTMPFEIRTNPKNRNLFDKNADYVIAYGGVESGKSIDEWIEFTVELEYRDTHRVPTYILIVSSASKYGDFFTGGSGSTLMIDNYRLEWDYE